MICGLLKAYACATIDCTTLKWSYLVKSTLIVIVVAHYFLMKRYRKLALHYASFLTVLYMIDAIEELQHDRTSDELQIYAIIMTLLACLAVISYCQKEMFFAYLIGYSYTLIRSYFIFPLNDKKADAITHTFSLLRFNIFMLMSLAANYTFSRRYH